MELKQLRCLIAVADTLHFGRAAQRMNMLPASFGRHIRLLEEDLGCRLLTRTTRHVALTEAGRLCVDGAREIVAQAEGLEAAIRDSEQAQGRLLRIGVIDSAAAGLMPQLLPHLAASHPDLEVELLEDKTIRLLPRLLSGRLDLAIIRPPETADARLVLRRLFSETAVVAVPEGHPLAQHDRIGVADMADEPLIVPDRGSRPHSHDLTIKLFLEAGHSARIAQIAEEKQTIVSLVGTGVGLAIVPRWAARLAVRGVRFIPLDLPEGAPRHRLELAAAWPGDTRHGARDAFLEVLEHHVATLAQTA
jgi:DNA-binding transcriptional LysR family regulator